MLPSSLESKKLIIASCSSLPSEEAVPSAVKLFPKAVKAVGKEDEQSLSPQISELTSSGVLLVVMGEPSPVLKLPLPNSEVEN